LQERLDVGASCSVLELDQEPATDSQKASGVIESEPGGHPALTDEGT
jgi:hypothetical protein